MSQDEEVYDQEPDMEEVSAIERWIDDGNPNVWDPRTRWQERRGKEEIDPTLIE